MRAFKWDTVWHCTSRGIGNTRDQSWNFSICLQCLAEKLVFCWLWKIWYSYVCNQNWKMIDTSLERPDSQLWSAVSKISKLSRLLSFRLNLIWAKITQFSKLNNFVTDEYFFLKLCFQRALTNVMKCSRYFLICIKIVSFTPLLLKKYHFLNST